jgi:broad specificity phosphatase PhoE
MMSIQLTLFSQATTSATRLAAFAANDPLEAAGLEAAQLAAGTIRRVDAAWSSPAAASRETAAALGLIAREEPELREIDYGGWAGRPMDEVSQTDPAGFAAWLSDPFSAPHGGESIDRAVARTAQWLGSLDQEAARVVAVTHASIIRAAIVTVLDAPLAAFWRIDVPPLCRASLQRRGRVWTLRWVGPMQSVG